MNADSPKVPSTKPDAVPAKPKARATKVKKAEPAKAVAKKPAEAKKAKKETKIKVVRDSFTMPRNEYQKIADIKEACLKAGMHVKKSEVLRAGLQALAALSVPQLKSALGKLDKIATGRPKKH